MINLFNLEGQMEREIITLSNGKRVGNFSSPHPFTFTDGSVLPPVSNDEANRLKIKFIEDVDEDGDVNLDFDLTDDVVDEMGVWMFLHKESKVDVVLCPLPMLTAMRSGMWSNWMIKKSPFRTIRMEDRIKKLVSIDKQCL